MAAFLLVIAGGINWLLVGGFGYNYDLVAKIFGGVDAPVAKLIYVLVGLAAIYEVTVHKKNCVTCNS